MGATDLRWTVSQKTLALFGTWKNWLKEIWSSESQGNAKSTSFHATPHVLETSLQCAPRMKDMLIVFPKPS